SAPAAWADCATAAISVMVQRGLLGVSIQTRPVSPGRIAVFTALKSDISAKVIACPTRGSCRSQFCKPQYMSWGATIWVGSKDRKSAVAAAVPEPKTRDSVAPSNSEINDSAWRTDVLSARPYTLPEL